ncbi:2,3-diphosphoglycerate-dependent phosphoglycerate mutase [Stygiolobus caldivivus]|nr:2,3-diphosphoglycerate-dependent phosphoglycerate mutase [Stygiolobus caldivivus]
MVVLVFIRHAQSVSNLNRILSDDINKYPLTDEGRQQAKEVAKELRKLNSINKLFSSPILRAYQTATIIGEEIGLVPIIDDRLRERELGELNNLKIDEIHNWRIKVYRRELPSKGLEPWEILMKRIANFVEDIVENEKGIIIAVSHYDPIRAFLSHILDLDDIGSWGISLPNASISIIKCESIDTKKCKILAIGTPILTSEILSKF